ncbi:competence protein [Elizabethkingia anophelis]|uniref:competence protein CoiA n=1 Tax=Elizabethkingia anophelis TaxID=1117645 RepID=UPI00293553FE|nr:competence protein [Elizabethkingia anophelis]MDV3471515.1 competence protein [Elizabethkingia anophelis]MDV3903473.1 competence protein [Elizabethkingia anophelis]
MRFALVDNKRTEPKLGLKGICPACSQIVIARCGEQRIHHWAHKSKNICIGFREKETEWHRAWKNQFDDEWQEVRKRNEVTGEIHIVDICTDTEYVIEFQHSFINQTERKSREDFNKNMVWVVDGSRLKTDYDRFLSGKVDFRSFGKKGIYQIEHPEKCFPKNWINSKVPVIFDFKGNDINDDRNNLYCLFAGRTEEKAIIAELPRKSFIKAVIDGNWNKKILNFITNLDCKNQIWETNKAIEQKKVDEMLKYIPIFDVDINLINR